MRVALVGLALVACDSKATTSPAPDAAVETAMPESIDVVSSCTLPPDGDAVLTNDVVYATPDGQPQSLDIAVPKTPGPHPLVVFVHGGGWTGGDKSIYHPHQRVAAGMGFASASIDYRLVSVCDPADAGACKGNFFPADVSDVRCAVRWLRANAATYGYDVSRVVAIGDSAGGHLAAMLGVGRDVQGLDDGSCPVSGDAGVEYVVSFFGQMDLLDWPPTWPYLFGVAHLLGTPAFDSDPALARFASPIAHVGPQSATFLLVHGVLDDHIPYAQSYSMRNVLGLAGVPATLVTLPNAGHGFSELDLAPDYVRSTCTWLAFLRKYLAR